MEKTNNETIFECKTPANIADTLANSICVRKTNASLYNLLILGFLAGVYIAFGASLYTQVTHDAPKFIGVGLSQFIGGGVFSVGLMLVVIAGAELFTGNNLMLMSVLGKNVPFNKVLGKWTVMYLANFLGSVFMAYLMFKTSLWKNNSMAVGVRALTIANIKTGLSFSEAFFRAIGCNWLVCLAIWMALASREIAGKVLAIFFPIMAFIALGFEHSVANMYLIPVGILLKTTAAAQASGLDLTGLTWVNFIVKNLIPVTIGNVIGGAFFVGCLYWSVYVRKTK